MEHSPSMIRRRCVYHIAGYDSIGSHWYRLFKRELQIFARTWAVAPETSELASAAEDSNPTWTVTTVARNWRVETNYVLLLWDDIVNAYRARSTAARLARASLALLNFIWSGAVFRYFWANWKYAVFFLFPFVMICFFAAAGFLAAGWIANYLKLSGIAWFLATTVLGAAGFLILLRWPGRRWHVLQTLDDTIFSWDYLYGRRPVLEARLDRFAETIVAQVRRAAADEIVIVGHSMGATFLVEVVARALARDPELGRHGPAVCLLTVGSTLPKFTLHPAGDRIRRQVARVASEPSVAWAEYHARADAVSFYKFDAVTESHFDHDRIDASPIIRRVQLHAMIDRRTMRRTRFKFMRRHYQVVMANQLRAPYDYFMIVCGPLPFLRSVRAQNGPLEFIAPDGALIDPPAPATPLVVDGAAAGAQSPQNRLRAR